MEEEKKKKKNNKKKNKNKQKSGVEENSSNINIDERSNHNAKNAEATDNSDLSADPGKDNWLQEEARLRDMVKKLLYEKDSYLQRQANLEMEIEQLKGENVSWHQKEVILEQRISHALQEQASSSSEKMNLQEKVRHIEKDRALLVENENTNKEMIAELNNEIARLQTKVVKLEGDKKSISQENRELIVKVSTLHSQIQDLETRLASAQSFIDAQKDASEKEDLKAEMEAACSLVEKLVTENAELVEKMNELYMELNSRNTPKHFEQLQIAEEQRHNMDTDRTDHMARHLSEITMPEEIVQIPLEENEPKNHDIEAQPNEVGQNPREEEEDVGLTEAPLIGAPFRLISFFAKYVSGADLVDNTSESV